MSNTYNWSLQNSPLVSPSLDGLTNVIVSVDWCVTAEDKKTKITAYRYGGPVTLGAPSPAAFTPFEKVATADVVGWCQDAMGKDHVADIIKALDAEIEAKIKAAADPSTPVPMALKSPVVAPAPMPVAPKPIMPVAGK